MKQLTYQYLYKDIVEAFATGAFVIGPTVITRYGYNTKIMECERRN